ESYWISKYPITNGQYAKFIAAGGYRTIAWWSDVLDGWDIAGDEGWIEPLFWKNRNFNTKTQPVVDISWYEAMAFCAWLSDKTGEEITLPTEAQWQYASQGGDERAYPWGDEWHDTMCCHSHNSNGRTTSVTQYNNVASEHPFGVADMIGNVWEWTLTQRTPARPDRICRGGCWEIYSLNTFRCDHRPGYGTHPKTRTSSRGFRIVRNG
ncbi:MAG: SUMF1/EgtB/PvdO family nonheme iron enzyme, partial [Chloroflexota bacterium]